MEETVFTWNLPPDSPMGIVVVLMALLVLAVRIRLLLRLSAGVARWLTEGLTGLGVFLLALTAFQPEWHHVRIERSKPVLTVIRDETASMGTVDVDLGSNVVSRQAWAETFLESDAFQSLNALVDIRERILAHPDGALRETDLATALAEEGQESDSNMILLISDGDHNADRDVLPEAIRLQQRGIRLFALAPGQEQALPDLVLESPELPSYALAHEPLTFPVRVRSSLTREAKVEVRLKSGKEILVRQSVTVKPGDTYEGMMQWVPRVPGAMELTLEVSPHRDEQFPENNQHTLRLDVRDVQLKVLLIDRVPRWEFRYLRNAMIRDPGVKVECLLLHPDLGPAEGDHYLPAFPAGMEALSEYDVVFLGDVGPGPGGLTVPQVDALEQLVRLQGSGLVFLPGSGGQQVRLLETGLQDLLPVEYDVAQPAGHGFDEEMQLWLTSEGRGHLLTKLHSSPSKNHAIWKQLPGFHWYAPVLRSRVGSDVLATHATRRNRFGRIPMLVVRDVEAGKTLFLGTDSAWRWRWGLEDTYHYRFWGQVVRWMAHKRHMFDQDQARVFLSPERPMTGQSSRVAVTLLTASAAASLGNEALRLRFTSESGEVSEPGLNARSTDGSSWEGDWTPSLAGTLQMQVLGQGDQVFLDTEVLVVAPDRERVGHPLNLRLLREVTRLQGGRTVRHPDADLLLQELQALPQDRRFFERTRIWQHPLWISLLVGCFALSWILRKRQGWI